MSNKNDRWSALSIKERADLMNMYITNGISDLKEMKKHYNSFSGEDDTENNQPVISEELNPSVVVDYSNLKQEAKDARDWVFDYYASKGYKNRARQAGLKTRNPLKKHLGIFPKRKIAFLEDQSVDYSYNWLFPVIGLQESQDPFTSNLTDEIGFTSAHEFAHNNKLFNSPLKSRETSYRSPYYGYNYRKLPNNYFDALKVTKLSNIHDSEFNESYSDLVGLRYLLNKYGIFDSMDPNTKFDFNLYKTIIKDDRFKNNRFLKLHDVNQVIKAINEVAHNITDSNRLDYINPENIAADGGKINSFSGEEDTQIPDENTRQSKRFLTKWYNHPTTRAIMNEAFPFEKVVPYYNPEGKEFTGELAVRGHIANAIYNTPEHIEKLEDNVGGRYIHDLRNPHIIYNENYVYDNNKVDPQIATHELTHAIQFALPENTLRTSKPVKQELKKGVVPDESLDSMQEIGARINSFRDALNLNPEKRDYTPEDAEALMNTYIETFGKGDASQLNRFTPETLAGYLNYLAYNDKDVIPTFNSDVNYANNGGKLNVFSGEENTNNTPWYKKLSLFLTGKKDVDFSNIKTTGNRKYNPELIKYINEQLDTMDINRRAVILGDIIEESGGNPFAKSENGTYQGLLQWGADRYRIPENQTDTLQLIDNQLKYIIESSKNTKDGKSWTHGGKGSGYNSLIEPYNIFWDNDSTLEDKHKAFSFGYVRPKGKNASEQNRLKVVKQIAEKLK